jgi:hypothetical protein
MSVSDWPFYSSLGLTKRDNFSRYIYVDSLVSFYQQTRKNFSITDSYKEIESVVYIPQISRPDVAKLRPAKDFSRPLNFYDVQCNLWI